jgi:hypothetical protein
MKPIWWLLVIAMGIVFYILGRLNVQISNFKVFISLCFLSVWVALLLFWFFQKGKTHR